MKICSTFEESFSGMANRKKENPLVRVTLSLDPQDYKRFEHLARKEDRSTAYLVRQAMRDFLLEHDGIGISVANHESVEQVR